MSSALLRDLRRSETEVRHNYSAIIQHYMLRDRSDHRDSGGVKCTVAKQKNSKSNREGDGLKGDSFYVICFQN